MSPKREVILVVDDEPFVLNIVCSILRNAGFTVLPAGSPGQALEVGSHHPGPIDLMLSDVVMPGLTGPALADRFEEIRPETRSLFMAGLPDSPEIWDRVLNRGRAFLPKPFLPHVLINKVQEVLARSTGDSVAAA